MPLADVNAVVAENVVGCSGMEIKIRQRALQQQIDTGVLRFTVTGAS